MGPNEAYAMCRIVGGLYLTVADSLARLPIDNKNVFQAISNGRKQKMSSQIFREVSGVFNSTKNSAVLEPRTGQFSRTWGFEAKDLRVRGQGQGLENVFSRTPPLVSWVCIHELRMARRKTVYPNWQGNCNIENFVLFSCCEMRIVKKKQSSQFSKQSSSLFTNCVSTWTWKLGNDWKGAIASAIVQNEVCFSKKGEGITLLTECASLEIRNFLKPLLLQIERSQLRWFGNVSRRRQEKLSNKLYSPKQMGKK